MADFDAEYHLSDEIDIDLDEIEQQAKPVKERSDSLKREQERD